MLREQMCNFLSRCRVDWSYPIDLVLVPAVLQHELNYLRRRTAGHQREQRSHRLDDVARRRRRGRKMRGRLRPRRHQRLHRRRQVEGNGRRLELFVFAATPSNPLLLIRPSGRSARKKASSCGASPPTSSNFRAWPTPCSARLNLPRI